ncbi:hypothetical protein ABPG75_003369 [Micractinium tetrahymenae]
MASSSDGDRPSGRFELRELLGKGSFGTVHRGYDTVAQRDVAIKLIDLEDIEEDIGEIQREIAMLKQCQSPNITQYYGSQARVAAVPGTSQLMIVMELMAASAADLVSEETAGEPLSEPCIAHIMRQVLHALAYLHAEHRIHRDVKAANILLAEDGAVKVSDFGVSAQLSGTVGFKRRTFVGSPLWMAPEVIEQSPDNVGFRSDGSGRPADGYDEAADIWSLGITAMELASGEPPRVNVASFRLLFMIVRDDPPQLEGGQWSTDFKDFVWQCLRKDPKARPSALDLLEHPFVMGADQPPAELAQRVAAFQQRRPSLLERQQQRLSGAGGYGTWGGATVPRWDFAPPAASTPAGAAAGPAGKGTVVANSSGSVARPATAPPPGDFSGTVRAAAADSAAAAAGPEFPGGPVARRFTDTVVGPPAAAAAAAADYGCTVQTRPGGGGSTKPAAAPPSRLVIPNDPTQPEPPSGAVYLTRTGSATAGDGGASKQLLTAGLQAAAGAPGAPPAAAAAADTAGAALSQLEAARPGAVRDALTELLTQLSLASSPSLAGLKGTAEALFGAGEGGGGGATSGGGQGLGEAPDLGPLGRFLMSRWREAVARERVQLSQQWQQAS